MENQFSDTLDVIYAAASGERRWHDALQSIEELTGSVGAVIGFVPRAPQERPFNLAGRFTLEQCETYSELYQPICRRTRYMIDHPQLDAIYDALLITEQEMSTDPVYDWFGQHGLRYFVGAALPHTRSHQIVFSLQRSAAQGHVQGDDIALFKQVARHVGRALTLADQLGTSRSLSSFGTAIAQALPQAVFALDGRGRVVFANDAAREVISRKDGLSLVGEQLTAVLRNEQAHLDQLIMAASTPALSTDSGWTRVSRPSGKTPYAVFVAPLRTFDDEFAKTAIRVLVIVPGHWERTSARPDMLSVVYGLTETEARLASGISAGHSVETAAALLNMRVATARSHLKSIFAKFGVNRQQDLVRLLGSLAWRQ